MKIIVAPDKFKGSLTSFEACEAIAKGVKNVDSSADLLLFPFADGGDGFAAVMKYYLHTTTVACLTVDPLGRKTNACYEWNPKTNTAIIEMAVASGLVLLKEHERDPLKTSTHGTGLLIKDAIDKGAKQIILGLGGSATNDAGSGILAALGFQFRDVKGNALKANGENLSKIEKIIPPVQMPGVKFEIACDVQNKLYGPQGAAYVYAAQKGATSESIKLLDEGLKHFAAILNEQTGHDVANVPGTGAAGGIAAGLMGYFNVQLKKGIHLVMEASGIKNEISYADVLITGEGKIDEQTLEGKVVSELASLASQCNVPVIAFCGMAELSDSLVQKLGLKFIETLVDSSTAKEQAITHAREILTYKVTEFFKYHFTSNLQ